MKRCILLFFLSILLGCSSRPIEQLDILSNNKEITLFETGKSVLDENNWKYTWLDERLIKVVNGNLSVESKYDTIGRRIEKKVFVDDKLIKYQLFSYDNLNLVAIYDLLKNKDIPIARFDWRGGNPSVLYSMNKNNKIYYYVINNSNDVIALVDEDGNSLAQYIYNPFGGILALSGPISGENPFRAECGFYDEETELLLIGTRYYNPRIGTWVEPKDLRQQPAEPSTRK